MGNATTTFHNQTPTTDTASGATRVAHVRAADEWLVGGHARLGYRLFWD